ncbi:MAG: hypothetical protein LBI39_00730 [Puniceicoccales bacterium]|jgi:hypothetical protein|nr:hypothetical protein [Puniceicoccales bacterium]
MRRKALRQWPGDGATATFHEVDASGVKFAVVDDDPIKRSVAVKWRILLSRQQFTNATSAGAVNSCRSALCHDFRRHPMACGTNSFVTV